MIAMRPWWCGAAIVIPVLAGGVWFFGLGEPTRASVERGAPRWVPPRGGALGLYPEAHLRRELAWPPDPCELAALGADSVSLPVILSQWGLDAVDIERDRGTISDEDLRTVIRRARSCGLRVVLSPMLEVRGGQPGAWRGRIRPRAPERWWSSYRRAIGDYARLARDEGVAALVVSHELSSMSSRPESARWRRLVRGVRRIYRGPVAVVVNHDALDAELPFDAFDVVGVSAYFRLASHPDATAAELRAGWRAAAARLGEFSTRLRRPIVLFEVGYPSIDGCATRPWDSTLGAPIDLEEQRMATAAAVDAIDAMPFVEGAFLWAWGGDGGPYDRWYTPRGKPTEAEWRRFFAGTAMP